MKKNDPYGDGGGARVGKPDTPQRDNKGKGSLGSSKESSGGIARQGLGGVNEDRSATAPAKAARAKKAQEQATADESGYGGKLVGPKTSSDEH